MTPCSLEELIDRWNRGQLAEVQVITHMLQHLLAQALRITALERRLVSPKHNGTHEGGNGEA